MNMNVKKQEEKTPHGSILIIEDSALFYKQLIKKLKAFHYQVTLAKTLHDALEKLMYETFDLIILDLNLPDGEGELILQNLNFIEKLKIIIYTSDVDKDRRNEWFRYGVLNYLSKNDPLSYVIQEINTVMKALKDNTFYSILIVDDSKFVCNQVSSLLIPRNYRLSIANTAEEATAYLKVKKFDLVILDLELPDMHGSKLLKAIRHDYTALQIPVFILTGQESQYSVGDLLKLGANEFFKKPFVSELLLHKIDFWIDIKKAQNEKSKEEKLLQQYKDIIDKSAIVSKTNVEGTITYVNDKFCEISGYTEDELVGKKHDVVRHADMTDETYHTLWNTILHGKIWNGIIKGQQKNGSPYWVNASIHPILNYKGEIQEFLAIRHDITQIQILKENLRKALKISDTNFDNAYHLSKEYEAVINESNSVVRVSPEGIILFVNNRFCEISGYTQEEIHNQKFHILYADDIDQELLNNLWTTIQSGSVWRGVLKNKHKNGGIYWVKSTIVPIKDLEGNISEFVSLRSDITEVIKLHEEIESTQQEVIYRMGEIAESRSKETGNHVKRVAEYTRLLAIKYGLDMQEADLIATASPMHDIGKVGIPDDVLLKPGKLNDEEWEIMRTHAMLGYTVLKNSSRPLLQAAAIIAKEHHEKYNGTGYPMNLCGENIHLYARIVAIADVFDALSHDRCYKKAWEDEAIFYFFEKEKGKHFDPTLLTLFLSAKEEFLAIRDRLKDDIIIS